MITLENRFFPFRSAVSFFVEGCIIFASVVLSYLILLKYGGGVVFEWEDALVRGLMIASICQTTMYLLDLYDLRVNLSAAELVFSIMFSTGFVCIGIAALTFVSPEYGVGGNIYYITVTLIFVLLFLWRLLFDCYITRFSPTQNVMIVGSGGIVGDLEDEILSRRKMGFRLLGYVDALPESETRERHRVPCLGPFSEIGNIVREKGIRNVIVALTERRGIYPVNDLLSLRILGIKIVEWPDFFEKLSGRIPIDNLPPSYFIFNEGFRKPKVLLAIRRLESIFLAAMGLVLILPVFLLVSIIIKIDSKGPIFYTQERVGENGRLFRIMKFRSMRQDAEAGGEAVWAQKEDPRVTRVGKIIRKTRIDELPQLINVLRGDLDLVGPRPERPTFVAKLEKLIPYYSIRHSVKPGLTGWAQVMFTYCGTVEEAKEKLQYDLYYIKNMSFKLDLLIVLKTLKIVILGRGAR